MRPNWPPLKSHAPSNNEQTEKVIFIYLCNNKKEAMDYSKMETTGEELEGGKERKQLCNYILLYT